ncbi:cystine transport system permease protein [Paenibacillus phyllosphaerae]|uniref:Cystine transport system permease protein n=1 Tax=Paenibacillus phyllosphaerae TaxID=274593 RepID=A0A7W5AX64_9BACL|nr:amino acid ABC transporter permease [Paenibacillus phyllosphaerae]MBB3109761.1 cystine transport system permease protein [Paenibacillus phyllosphaerae]
MSDQTIRLWDIFIDSFLPLLKAGVLYTIPLSLISFVLGCIVALLTALARLSENKILSSVARFYVWLIRGTPLLVQLYIIFYGLPRVGLIIDPFPAAIIGFTLNVGAYNSEIVRAAILSISKGQWEAGFSLGMTKLQTLRRIVLPQATRVAVPPLSNSFISLVKDTSLAFAITVTEMFQKANQLTAYYYEPLLLYSEAALIYLIFSTVLSQLQAKLERRFDRFTAR